MPTMRCTIVFLAAFVMAGMLHAQDQMLLIQRMWADSPTKDYTDCVQVTADGSYRFEHTPVDLGRSGHRQIHLGKLSEEEMSQLMALLDDPAVKSLTTASKGPVSGGDLWWFQITRADQSQLLRFASSSGTYYEAPARGGLPNLNQTPTMKPLLNWYKQITKRKDDIAKNAASTCSLKVLAR